jgi:hypothetical protein
MASTILAKGKGLFIMDYRSKVLTQMIREGLYFGHLSAKGPFS